MGRGRRFGQEEPGDAGADRGAPADPESVARTIVLTKLAARARSRRELADALDQRQVPPEVAQRVLDRFGEVGLVDDAAFAKSWVESRQASRGLSRRALTVELRRKGIEAEALADSLAGIDDEAEYAAARRLVDKKAVSTRHRPPDARWRQLVGLLARRGYSSALSIRVVADALSAERSADGFADDVADKSADEGTDAHGSTPSVRRF